MTQTSYHSMPAKVRELRDPWKSLVGTIPSLTRELEGAFRFGHRVHKTEQGYLMGGNLKGGSSGVWRFCTRAEYEAYLKWQEVEGIGPRESEKYFRDLNKILEENQVVFLDGESSPFRIMPAQFHSQYGQVYQLTYEILQALPPLHLSQPTLRQLQLGGWGPDSAKGSAYQEGTIIMYTYTLKGARRAFAGLFLHEMGHAFEKALPQEIRDELEEYYQTLSQEEYFVGLEYLSNSKSRQIYQSFQFDEFLAETYLAYCSCGRSLIEFFHSLPLSIQKPWQRVYEIYKEAFDGYEYI